VGRKLHFRRLGVDTRIFLGTEAGTAGKGAGGEGVGEGVLVGVVAAASPFAFG
jgi:hypothetical protein